MTAGGALARRLAALAGLTATTTLATAAPAAPVLEVEPTAIELAPVEVATGSAGAALRVRNAGGDALSVDSLQISDVTVGATADWTLTITGACSELPCALLANQAIDIDLVFDPSRIGQRDAILIINYNDGARRTQSVSLDGEGLGATLDPVGPPVLDFGSVPLDHTSTLQLVLANHGNRSLADAVLEPAPPGAPFGLPAGPFTVRQSPPTTSLPITCRSASPGTFTSVVRISSPGSVAPDGFDVTLRCQVVDTPLLAAPTSLQLDELRIGTTPANRQLVLTSLTAPGEVELERIELAVPDPNLGLIAPVTPATTPATIELVILPQREGAIDNAIVVTPSGGGPPIRIALSGAVVDAAYFAPPAVSLGTFCVGQRTATTNLTLRSTGSATLRLDPPRMMREPSPYDIAFASPPRYPAALAPLAEATLQVTPEQRQQIGMIADQLIWTTDVAGARTSISELTAQFVNVGAAIAPAALQFGRVPIHLEIPNGQQVTLQNCDVSPLDLLPPEVSSPFAIDGTFPAQLMPSETATFSVAFRPTRLGDITGTLTVTGRQLDAPLVVTLSGEGILDNPGGDGANPPGGDDPLSFYACGSCASHPSSGWPLALALALALLARPRRRRRRR